MGYFVSREGKGWAVFYESKAVPRRRVRKADLANLGFGSCVTIEDARKVKDALNAQEKVRRRSDREQLQKQNARELQETHSAFLPEPFLSEFTAELHHRKIRAAHWHTAMRAIVAIGEPPERWRFVASKFYDFIRTNGFSIPYLKVIRRAVNEWGYFLSEKLGRPFRPIPFPTGRDRNAIVLAYEKYSRGPKRRCRPSGRLSFQLLEKHHNRFDEAEYRWLYVSIAFGLRPEELDVSLADPTKHAIRTKDGVTHLHIYQPKAERFEINPLRRWKKIPVKTSEQAKALEMLAQGIVKPPKNRMAGITDFRGRPVTYYGGRKEFFPSMRIRFSEADVSRWLGHRSLDTARKHYDDPTADAPDDEAA
jgi:hypothetical protein